VIIIGTKCPWPKVPEYPARFGSEDPEIAAIKVRSWLEKCGTTHNLCQSYIEIGPSYLPTRILEIEGSRKSRLYVPSTPNVQGQYVCLSHCWGENVPLQTTESTLRAFQDPGIAWETLPLSFQHAVDLTYQIGLKYLWIDSLCILQDSLEDWRHVGSKMAQIYSKSYITLATTAARSVTELATNIQNAGSSQSSEKSLRRKDAMRLAPQLNLLFACI
jgi:hypothetical protein